MGTCQLSQGKNDGGTFEKGKHCFFWDAAHHNTPCKASATTLKKSRDFQGRVQGVGCALNKHGSAKVEARDSYVGKVLLWGHYPPSWSHFLIFSFLCSVKICPKIKTLLLQFIIFYLSHDCILHCTPHCKTLLPHSVRHTISLQHPTIAHLIPNSTVSYTIVSFQVQQKLYHFF